MIEPNKQDRSGYTEVTSVSVSKEFRDLTTKYRLSPTEVYRKGVAISLCELGVERYNNPLNLERLMKSKEILKGIDAFQKQRIKIVEMVKLFKAALERGDEL